MLVRTRLLLSFLLLFTSVAIANNKKKNSLPAFVLQARTVLVIVNPDSGISVTEPTANRTAQEDVEKALMKWGRLTPVMNTEDADLIIAVRKGNGKMVNPTVTGVPVNDRPIILEPTGGDTRIGVQKGRPPNQADTSGAGGQNTGPHLGEEVGPAKDMFEVYRGGGLERPLDGVPVWRYIAKDALHSPDVPAVAEFRKIIEEAEKQQKGKP